MKRLTVGFFLLALILAPLRASQGAEPTGAGSTFSVMRFFRPPATEELRTAWEAAATLAAHWEEEPPAPPKAVDPGPGQFMVLVTCRDEKHQLDLLARFHEEGLECKALLT